MSASWAELATRADDLARRVEAAYGVAPAESVPTVVDESAGGLLVEPPPAFYVGLLCALPCALLMWAALWGVARLFHIL